MIRPRTEEDLPACAEALRRLQATDRYPHSFPDDPLRWLRPPRQRQAWIAVDAGSGDVVGHVAVNVAEGDPAIAVATAATGLEPEQLAFVSRLFVLAEFRQQGLGRGLLDVAATDARRRGRRPVLDVLEADQGAIRLYEASGWIAIGRITFHSAQGEPLPAIVYAAPEMPAVAPPEGPPAAGPD